MTTPVKLNSMTYGLGNPPQVITSNGVNFRMTGGAIPSLSLKALAPTTVNVVLNSRIYFGIGRSTGGLRPVVNTDIIGALPNVTTNVDVVVFSFTIDAPNKRAKVRLAQSTNNPLDSRHIGLMRAGDLLRIDTKIWDGSGGLGNSWYELPIIEINSDDTFYVDIGGFDNTWPQWNLMTQDGPTTAGGSGLYADVCRGYEFDEGAFKWLNPSEAIERSVQIVPGDEYLTFTSPPMVPKIYGFAAIINANSQQSGQLIGGQTGF